MVLALMKALCVLPGKFLAFFSLSLSYETEKGRRVSKYVEIGSRGVAVQLTGVVG